MALLRRPTAPDVEPRRKGDAEPPPALTEAEILEALAGLDAERAAAESFLAGAAERREQLLAEPGSDDDLIKLGHQIDRSNLVLERLDRVAPDLRRALGEVRTRDRDARWIADRDAAAAALAEFVAPLAEYEKALARWARVRDGLAARWPDVDQILPRMARIDGARAYEAALERFRQVVIIAKPPPVPIYHTVADAVYYAEVFGSAPDGIPGEWLQEVERARTGSARVIMTISGLDSAGRQLPKGSVVDMNHDEADRAVRGGRARYASPSE